VPMVGIDVRAPALPHGVKLEILKALRTSPASVLACLLNGLVLTGFYTVGPLFGVRIGFDQQHTVLLMAFVSLGSLLLQWPIGYLSDKVDRLYMLIALGVSVVGVAAALLTVDHRTPFLLIGLLLLFVWALGAAIGPTTGTYAIQLISPSAFFGYVMALTLAFTGFALWRLYRRKLDLVVEEREEFLTYPQTSPQIYAWLPYHRETPGESTAGREAASTASAGATAPAAGPSTGEGI